MTGDRFSLPQVVRETRVRRMFMAMLGGVAVDTVSLALRLTLSGSFGSSHR